MSRITKADLQASCDAARRDLTVAQIALSYLGSGSPPDCRIVITAGCDAGESYELRLYGSTLAHGGILTVTSRYPNQRAHTTAHYFDDWHQGARRAVRGLDNELNVAMRNACDEFAGFRACAYGTVGQVVTRG